MFEAIDNTSLPVWPLVGGTEGSLETDMRLVAVDGGRLTVAGVSAVA